MAFQRIHERRRSSIFEVARAVLFEVRRDGVDVSGIAGERDLGAAAARQVDQALQQVMGAIGAFEFDDCFERVEPLLRFNHIGIVGGLRQELGRFGLTWYVS
jgi:hypothetical protein